MRKAKEGLSYDERVLHDREAEVEKLKRENGDLKADVRRASAKAKLQDGQLMQMSSKLEDLQNRLQEAADVYEQLLLVQDAQEVQLMDDGHTELATPAGHECTNAFTDVRTHVCAPAGIAEAAEVSADDRAQQT